MQKQSVFQYLKNLYKSSGIIGKIIGINLAVFLFFGLLYAIDPGDEIAPGLRDKVALYFAGPGHPLEIIYKPWTLITQLFTHIEFFHLLFNMLVFYFTTRMFLQFFSNRRLILTYLMGGMFAYLAHVIIYYTVPTFQAQGSGPVVGASGSIMAIFMALAFYRPKMTVLVYGLIKTPIIVLALLYVFLDVSAIGSNDHVAHFAHLGGALFGALSIVNADSPKNFMNRLDRFFGKMKRPKLSFKRKPKLRVINPDTVKKMDDYTYREAKTINQDRIDAILEKISKKGYEGLTKEEKEILFNESKRK